MTRILQIFLPIVLAISTSTAIGGKVFKWIDDEGVPQYTDTAPTDRSYTVVETHGAPKSAEAALKKRAEELNKAKASNEEPIDFEAQKEERERIAKIRAENCKNARLNLKTIQENARVRIMGEDGEFRYLSEEERQAQLDQAKDVIDQNCEADSS